jgi:hypothetical protein
MTFVVEGCTMKGGQDGVTLAVSHVRVERRLIT